MPILIKGSGGAQKTPEINVSSSGLITATAGTKSATKQLTTQASKTITPSTNKQTAAASGVYTTGAVTVAGDSNLVSGNIKSGVSIFGVSGSYKAYSLAENGVDELTIGKTSYGNTYFRITDSNVTTNVTNAYEAYGFIQPTSKIARFLSLYGRSSGLVSGTTGEPSRYCNLKMYSEYYEVDEWVAIVPGNGYFDLICYDDGSIYDLLDELGYSAPSSWDDGFLEVFYR